MANGVQDVVFDLHEIRCGTCDGLRLCDDDCEHIAVVRRPPTLWDEHRPIFFDDSDVELAGNVGAGEDCDHTLNGLGRRCVDPKDIGACVVGEAECSVQKALRPDVVHVAAFSERELDAFVLRAGITNTFRRLEGP